MPVTFNLNAAQSKLTGLGYVTGKFFGSPTVSTIYLIGQFTIGQPGSGDTTTIGGTIDGQVGFSHITNSPIRFRANSAVLDPNTSGSWAPGTWDPNTKTFITPKEPADFGLTLPNLVYSALRDVKLTQISDNNAVSAGSFPGLFGLQFSAGDHALDPTKIGEDPSNDPLSNSIVQFEVATGAEGNGYVAGDIIWREKTGTTVVNGNTINTYGNIVPAFTSPDPGGLAREPVQIYDMTTGLNKSQLFPNDPSGPTPIGWSGYPNPVGPSSLTATPTGGGNYNLSLVENVNATARFFLGAYQVSFGFVGKFTATGTAKVPILGDANNSGTVTGADYTLWADNFQKLNGNALYTQGDWNGDGFVTGADYTIWADHFSVGAAFAPVPEPSTAALAIFGALACGGVAWRKRRRRRARICD
ncbi:MAG: PEP-CTERM sorting domain-containing protein [Pirellulales bacterium]|nr:PEP-CTERM sorting domain-containing protein [Pirellulales bacterium]